MNKKILVSGSSKGIGFTIAKKLLEEGNQVVIHSRNRKKLFQLKKYDFTGAVFGDLSKNHQAKNVISQTINILGGLDVLICNAGQSKSSKPNKENYGEWVKMFNQNFLQHQI